MARTIVNTYFWNHIPDLLEQIERKAKTKVGWRKGIVPDTIELKFEMEGIEENEFVMIRFTDGSLRMPSKLQRFSNKKAREWTLSSIGIYNANRSLKKYQKINTGRTYKGRKAWKFSGKEYKIPMIKLYA